MSFPQVIYANVSTKDKPPAPLDDVDTPFKIKFTYGAKWIQTECVQFFSNQLLNHCLFIFVTENDIVH